ncbi:sugar transporter ERD6-like 5 [Leguminivora glycinivorella]|uniref:sugar transporter ERD6-like 5 n=1 Tax=Leguminivora glycinivorella TaxID=1035111 RepID=UPI00201024E7|nr:sugar transporter ERD6-like 5 [Leguminivora glycinivorella]
MSLVRQCLCAGMISYLCMSMGATFTWPSSTLQLFSSENTTLHRPMTGTEQSLFGSLSSIGAVVATPVAGFLLDVIGRKYCAGLFSLMQVIAWVMIIASNRVEVLLTAMFIFGVGGAAFLVVPLYISEVCQESIRGAMTSGTIIFYGLGMTVSYALGGYVDYYPTVYAFLSISVLGVVLLSFLEESPTFLMMKGREQETAKSIAFYRAAKVSSKVVQQELDTIRRILNAGNLDDTEIPLEEQKLRSGVEKKQAQKPSIIQLIKKSYPTRRALLIMLGLTTASVFQGLIVIQVYAESLFSTAIPTMSATISSIIFSIITLASGLVAGYLTEVAGRKPLMLYSSLVTGTCCVLLGSQIHVSWGPPAVTAVIIYIFCVAYWLGAGTIPFVLSAEVFLPEVIGILSMLAIEWTWLCSFIILFIFPPLVAAIGLGPVFYIFAVVCFATSVFTYFFLPETKGLPVDVIQTLFDKKRHRHFSHN